MLLQGIYTIQAGDEQTDKMKNASKPIKNAISTTDFYWRFFSVLCMNGQKNPSTTSLYIAVIDASYGVAYTSICLGSLPLAIARHLVFTWLHRQIV